MVMKNQLHFFMGISGLIKNNKHKKMKIMNKI